MGTIADVADVTDDDLIGDIRRGRSEAFGELYRRHHDVARRFARSLVRSDQDAEDAVADAFTCILAALRNDAGPTDGFRPYLLASVRHQCARRARQQARRGGPPGTHLDGQDGVVLDAAAPHTTVVDGSRWMTEVPGPERVVERHLVSAAFARLQPRWRTVLWMTEVEQREPADVAAVTGLDTAGVAAALYRAREGFAESYLAQHLDRAPAESCSRFAPKLARYVRGTAGDMTRRQVDAHVARCTECAAAVRDLEDVNQALRGQLAPGLLVAATMGGGGGMAGLATLAGGAAMGWLAKVALIAAAAIAVPVALTADTDRSASADAAARRRAAAALDERADRTTTDRPSDRPASDGGIAQAGGPGASDRGEPSGSAGAPTAEPGAEPGGPMVTSGTDATSPGSVGASALPDGASGVSVVVATGSGGPTVPDMGVPGAAVPGLPVPPSPVDVTIALGPDGAGSIGVAADAGPLAVSASAGLDTGVAIAVDVSTPPVSIPGVAGLPGVTLPGVTVPGVTVPGVTVPGVTVPVSVALPGVSLPATGTTLSSASPAGGAVTTVPGTTVPGTTAAGSTATTVCLPPLLGITICA